MSEINFVVIDAKQINKEIINDFEAALGATLYPSDERRIFLDQETQVIVNLKNDINETGKQNLLRYAKGERLDAIGERTDTTRLLAQKSKTTLRFTLSSIQATDITVPQGTRATPDGAIYFITTQDIVIPAGQLSRDILSEATEAGEKYNDFAPGQIKTIVDPVAYVKSVSNIDISYGGSDIEDDDNYRERIRQAPSKFSTAGPSDAYIYWAKTADVNIQDVAVTSPSPGQVKITVLMKDGVLPTQEVLDTVLSTCGDKKRRPLSDQVITSSPSEVNYNINLTYYISEEKKEEETTIKENIEGVSGAIEKYKSWQNSKLGRPINPDQLRSLMFQSGANKIDVTKPAYTSIAEDAIGKVDTVVINYGGLISG